MGLDMYLEKETYVGAHSEHRNVTGKIEVKVDDDPLDIDFSRVSIVSEQIGYWRKANAIHNWFVQNCQDGMDQCQRSRVSVSQLLELRELCEEVLETRDATPLPPVSGFFFGSTEVDEWYWDDIRHTINVLKDLNPADDQRWDISYYYQSSW